MGLRAHRSPWYAACLSPNPVGLVDAWRRETSIKKPTRGKGEANMNHLAKNKLARCSARTGLGGWLPGTAAALLAGSVPLVAREASAAADPPLVLEKTIPIPDVPTGPY